MPEEQLPNNPEEQPEGEMPPESEAYSDADFEVSDSETASEPEAAAETETASEVSEPSESSDAEVESEAESPVEATAEPQAETDSDSGQVDASELDDVVAQAQAAAAEEAAAEESAATETPADESSAAPEASGKGTSNSIDNNELEALFASGIIENSDPEPAADSATPTVDQADINALLADAEAQVSQAAQEAEAGDDDDDIMAQMAAAIAAESGGGGDASAPAAEPETPSEPAVVGGGAGSKFPASAASEIAMPNFDLGGLADGLADIQLLDDVELNVKIELGRTEMYVEDVLQLGVGSVVELDKLAGDPVDIFVNEQLVAHGEVLVLNDNFCVRINELVSPMAPDEVEA